jgi:hypothetical protein
MGSSPTTSQTGSSDLPSAGLPQSSANSFSAGASSFGIAGAGLGAYAQILASQGVAAGDNYKAATLENAAQRGRVAAVQTGASDTETLVNTLGNIDAVRAAAHADPTSPTGAAIRDWNEQLGLTKKSIDVDNIMAQSAQEDSDAAYLRSASKYALLGGDLGAAGTVLGAIGKAAAGFGGSPASVVPAGYNPNSLSGLY